MILTKGQEEALAMARKLKEYKTRPFIAVLAGYAGTGKTTMLKVFAEELGYPIIVTPTGKAALRVKEATGLAAKTIHSWLYDPWEDEQTGEVKYTRKNPEEMDTGDGFPVVVIDESSMVNEDLWNEIHDACTVLKQNILIVGDGFQLPPVQKTQQLAERREFSLLSEHFLSDQRVLLTEVMRQALESPIIRASMMIRDGDCTKAIFELPRIRAAAAVEKAAEIVSGGGVVIVHRNETRNRMNSAIRQHLGKPEDRLVAGEPLLVLQNNYRTQRFNGETMKFSHWVDPPGAEHGIDDWIRKQKATSQFGVAMSDYDEKTEKGTKAVLCVQQVLGKLENIHMAAIGKKARILFGGSGEETLFTPMTEEERERALGIPIMHANLGYAMTCHKCQGSEYNQVLVVLEPSVKSGMEEGRRWLYTAITRSKDQCFMSLGSPL